MLDISSRLAAALLVVAAGCAQSTPSVEASLPVTPGEAWTDARGALARLDPQLHEVAAVKGRSAAAKAELVIAGYRFEEVRIVGAPDYPFVRSVVLSAPAPSAGCEKAREDVLRALGSSWSAGETTLGATTAKRGSHAARITCSGGELSLAFIG